MSEFKSVFGLFSRDEKLRKHRPNIVNQDKNFIESIKMESDDLIEFIEKSAFDELLEIAEEMQSFVDCPGPWDRNSTCVAECCTTCMLQDKFTAFKKRLGKA